MASSIFEIDLDGDSVVVWEAGSGSRIICPDPDTASRIAGQLQAMERQFHDNKQDRGVAVVYAFGEDHTPYTYVRRLLKLYQSGVAQLLGYRVTEGTMNRPESEFW